MPHRPPQPRVSLRRVLSASVGVFAVAAAVTACTNAAGQNASPTTTKSAATHQARSASTARAATTSKAPLAPFTVLGISPAAGASGVSTATPIVVRLSSALAATSHNPAISPAVAGAWTRVDATTLKFTPTVPWPAARRVTVSVPSGANSLVSAAKQTLRTSATASFVTTGVSTLRIQQLLAELHYLPLNFHTTGAAHTGAATATAETGTFSWRWAAAQSVLGSSWSAGKTNFLTHAALMDFQAQHGLSADGVAGPVTTAALIKDALTHKIDTRTYNFVHVAKGSPESLTLYVNGAVRFHVPVSTGITGATTYDGTFAVYEHVYYTEMKGTDVDGTKYDDNIYYASYFNGGEALHAYPRASYGFPQSNGCVEMNPATAKTVWPFTPLGTPVTVTG